MNPLPPLKVLQERLLGVDPSHIAIAKGMAWVSLFVLIGKAAGAIKEMAVAYRYGVSAEVDAYLFVLNIVSWPVAVWFSVLTVVLVPLEAQDRDSNRSGMAHFRGELLALTLAVGLILGALAWILVPRLLSGSVSGLTPATMTLAQTMVTPLAMLIPLGAVIGLLSVWVMTSGRFANTLAEGVPAVVIAITLLAMSTDGIGPLVWATVAGFGCQIAFLTVPLAARSELAMPRFTASASQWQAFWQGFGIMLLGQALMALGPIVDQVFAARLGEGALATLSYANRIVALFLGLGATAVSRATLPVFSSTASRETNTARRVAAHWVKLLFGLSLAITLLGWVFAPVLVRLLFERGAFTPANSHAVVDVLRFGLLQIPFFFSALVLVSYVSSRRQYKLLFWSGVIGLTTKIVMNAVLTPVFGLNGLAMSWAITYAANAIFLWSAMRRAL